MSGAVILKEAFLTDSSKDCLNRDLFNSQIFPVTRTQHTLAHSFLILKGDLPPCIAMLSGTFLLLGMLFTASK